MLFSSIYFVVRATDRRGFSLHCWPLPSQAPQPLSSSWALPAVPEGKEGQDLGRLQVLFSSGSADWELTSDPWLRFTSHAARPMTPPLLLCLGFSCQLSQGQGLFLLFLLWNVGGCKGSQSGCHLPWQTHQRRDHKRKQGKSLVSCVPSIAYDLGYFLEQTSQIRAHSNHSRYWVELRDGEDWQVCLYRLPVGKPVLRIQQYPGLGDLSCRK